MSKDKKLETIINFSNFLETEFTKEKLELIDNSEYLNQIRTELYKLNGKIKFLNIWNRIFELNVH